MRGQNHISESNDISASDTEERCLLIISCSKRKRSTHEKRPAIEVYDGPVYRTLRKRINHIRTIPVDICIISSKHGLIAANYEIESYDCKMTPARATDMADAVRAGIQGVVRSNDYREILVNLGALYRRTISGIDEDIGRHTLITFTCGGIGQRTSQTVAWLERVASPQIHLDHTNSRRA